MESAEAFNDLSLKMPGTLPPILWIPISTYPSTEVTENVFDFRLVTPYTNSRHCRLAFLQMIKMLVHVMGINLCQYLDDWLIYLPSHDQCLQDTVQVLNLCHTMDLLIHDKKSELIPKQKFLFLGYQFDLVSFQVTPTLDRYHKSSTDLLIPRRMCSYVADPALSLCVSLGRLHTCEAHNCISQHWDFNVLTSNSWIHLSSTVEKDFQWWKSAHNVLRGAPVTPTESDTQLFTAASNIGWGALWNALTVSGVWTTTEKTLHINVLELEATHRAMLHWLRKLRGLTVLVVSDNSTVVSFINKQGRTRSIQLCRRTKKPLLMCQAHLIVLRARHIPGRLNVLADILLHPSQMSGTEWSLHPSVF